MHETEQCPESSQWKNDEIEINKHREEERERNTLPRINKQ